MRRLALRGLKVGAGLALACAAVSAFAHAVVFAAVGGAQFRSFMDYAGPLPFSLVLLALLAGIVGFVPAALAIGLAELGSIRGWPYFAAAGALAGLFAVLAGMGIGSTLAAVAAALSGERMPPGFDPLTAALLVAAGVLAGLVYWALAGRSSGGWRAPTEPAPSGS